MVYNNNDTYCISHYQIRTNNQHRNLMSRSHSSSESDKYMMCVCVTDSASYRYVCKHDDEFFLCRTISRDYILHVLEWPVSGDRFLRYYYYLYYYYCVVSPIKRRQLLGFIWGDAIGVVQVCLLLIRSHRWCARWWWHFICSPQVVRDTHIDSGRLKFRIGVKVIKYLVKICVYSDYSLVALHHVYCVYGESRKNSQNLE